MNVQAKKKSFFIRFLKVVLIGFAICFCGLVLFISAGTYLFLSYQGKENTASKKTEPSEVAAAMPDSSLSLTEEKIQTIAETPETPKKRKKYSQLSPEEQRESDAKMKEGINFFREFAVLRESPQYISAPALCDIFCAPSTFKEKAVGEEVWDKFRAFMASEGSRSFDDPKFRLSIEVVNIVADAMLVTGEVWEEFTPVLERKNELSETEKIYWSLRAPALIAKVAYKVKDLLPEVKKQEEMVRELTKLNKQCDDKPLAEIADTCQAIVEKRFN